MSPPGTARRTAVALSGGGHRACLFALGVLLYLTDARRNTDVTSIASVSGGSLANGACAQALDYTTASPTELAPVVAAAARRAARGTLFAAKLTWLYIALLAAAAPAAVVLPWLLLDGAALQIVAMLLALLAVGLLATLRGRVCAQAYQRTIFATGGSATRLADVSDALDHVFCATDLHAGEHVYFSASFVYSYRFGVGTPDGVSLARVVQASAAFPGAFPAAWLRTAPYAFTAPAEPDAATTRLMALVDGGVYDNMGDQWAHGLANRRARLGPLADSFREADELVVVSASAGLAWSGLRALRLPLIGELLTLLRDKAVLYDNGNSVRRSELVSRFDLAERERRGLRGALVHIPQSPFDVPDHFSAQDRHWPERAARARAALAALEASGAAADARAEWSQVARENAAVATTLVGLGDSVAARLLHHAYVLAMVNLHVILGYPLLDVPERARFAALLEGSSAG